MKRKLYTRPVSVVLSDEVFDQIKSITDQGDIGFSDYIRDAIQKQLGTETINTHNNK
jgi:Arc/MetJ-type ribon-helix-helix transcriptional regulator